MTRFEYEPRTSFLHNRHPLAAGIAITYLSACAALYWNPFFILIVMILMAMLSSNSKVPVAWYKAVSITWLGYLAGLAITPTSITMVRPEFFKVLLPEFTSQVIFELTPQGFPVLGRTAITYGSGLWLLATIMRYPVFMVSGCMMVYTVNPAEAIQFLKERKFPPVIVLIIQAGLKYFSVVSQGLTNVWRAQRLRGFRIRTYNPFKMLRYVSPFLIPVGRQFVWTVDQVAISTSSRAFGASSEFHPYRELKRDLIDNLIIFCIPPLLLLQIYFLITPPYYFGLI